MTRSTLSCSKDGTLIHSAGRLPLHVAIWYSVKWLDGLSFILHANINVLDEFDPITNLAAFMLAAATKSKTVQLSGKRSNNDVSSDLNTVFELLRLRPSLINQR